MFSRLLARRKEREQAAEADRVKRLAADRLQAERGIELIREATTMRPCPVNNNKPCYAECVHFKEGSVYYLPSFDGADDGLYVQEYPKCRLWKS